MAKVVLFGAGEMGKKILDKAKYDVVAVIDNNSEMHGKQICGKLIISLEEYKKSYREYRIFITTYKMEEIKKQLYINGISDFAAAPEFYEDHDFTTLKMISLLPNQLFQGVNYSI